ncbi:glycosyl hydrolase family 18 protein [Geothrix sp. PMB-07]|uniref:glycosyl hydrolase family 18 protein n=1 Tax=Geothrix sp. PMB-07 TaxID=3068640 RepID=UPI0027426085|nr:glycosyl hydrolase family 18 protein [Geothrix sp. PMB-07]WLT30994.1 glycosyl hydrolase family 18 protein [Geothrix sp. PMB-07]
MIINPTAAAVQTTKTQQFTATVTGASNTAVTWSVQETAGGAMDATGLYTAPATAGTYHVIATSVADATKSATAAVTVTTTPPAVSVSISPATVSLQASKTQQFSATVTGSSNTAVTWTVQESGGGTVVGGLYTAPAAAGTYHVVATSAADVSKSATATVKVSAQGVGVTIAPSAITLKTGQTQQFTATVTGASNTAVTWTASSGTISANGLYTAPATAGSYTVTATSAADGTQSATAAVTVQTQQAGAWAFLSVANEKPGSYNSDVYRWLDSTKQQRTAVLTRNDAADPGGSHGGMLRQYRYFANGAERVVTGTGASGSWNGWGYLVNHFGDGGSVWGATSADNTGQYRQVFTGPHHAIHEFTWTYNMQGAPVKATVHWFMATGQDHPIYAITYDTSAAGASGFDSNHLIDSRSPYGDMQFGGDGSNPNVDGVAWGDNYKFFTRDEPYTAQSKWDYTQTNTVPYVLEYIKNPDAEMGSVQTLSWLQHSTGGTWLSDNWGHTSENRVVTKGNFGTWLMPANWNWPYQLNQYELGDSGPTASKRVAWGLMYGAVGQASFDNYGYQTKSSGFPYQSYSVYMVLGRHSDAAVASHVTQMERKLGATLTASKGTVAAQGPGGAGRTDSVTYAKAGYNATYGAFELIADATGAFQATLNAGAGDLKNPLFIVRDVAGVPSQITLGGTTLVADQDYFASYDAAQHRLWLTLNRTWSGSQVLGGNATGSLPTEVQVAPASVTLAFGATQAFTAQVLHNQDTQAVWTVKEGATGGTVSASGTYTAPSTAGTYHVRATSHADATKWAEATVTVVPAAPSITSFSASSASIAAGGSVTLSWAVTGNPTLTVGPAPGTVTGSQVTVTPAGTTTYVLTATNAGGTAVETVTVNVVGGNVPATWVVGYYMGYHRGLQAPNQVDYTSMTHVGVGSILPSASGTFDTTFWIDPTNGPAWAKQTVQLAHAAGTKVIVHVGGAGATGFTATSDPAIRATFVQNLKQIMTDYGFDGIDLNWESSVDRPTLLALLKAIRSAMPDKVLITPIGVNHMGADLSEAYYAQLARYVDRLDLMSYLLQAQSGWDSWFPSALHDFAPSHPLTIDDSVQTLIKTGVPKEKICIGVGFFGWPYEKGMNGQWGNAKNFVPYTGGGPYLTGPRQSTGSNPNGDSPDGFEPRYSDNDASYSKLAHYYFPMMTQTYDAVAQSAYLTAAAPPTLDAAASPDASNPIKTTYVPYDNEQSLTAKVQYYKTNGLGGMIIWTISEGYLEWQTSGEKDPLMKAIKAEHFKP